MALSSDPYEQKLYHMFQSHDVDSMGSLDREALLKLCLTLELKERGQLLVKCLLNEQKKRATFKEFREGLLSILGSEDTDGNHVHPPESGKQILSTSSPTITTTATIAGAKEAQSTTTTNTNTEDDTITTTNNNTTDNENENESSDREVSPKLVVGTKKYGRRSRPRDDVNAESSSLSNSDNESVPPGGTADANKKQQKVQRSASQSDIHGSKRRRPMSGTRLKRCASLPTQRNRPDLLKLNAKADRNLLNMDEKIDKKIYFMNLSENLKEIWDELCGANKYLNQSQLEIVCQKVGLQKVPAKLAAHEVFVKLSLKSSDGICFDEFISLLQSDSDILPIYDTCETLRLDGGSGFSIRNEVVRELNNVDEQDFNTTMPSWSTEFGSLSSSIIINMWESAGIPTASNFLSELGFYGSEVQIAELVTSLEEEQQRLGDSKDTSIIIRASLALHKAEVTALRQAFIQLVDENKKLYSDNKEANRRALLLAQEVDERHISIENSTRSEIRHIEQKHNETVKELTSQLSVEREQSANSNATLEKRIKTLESDEIKLKHEVTKLQDENDSLEYEQDKLTKQMTEMLEENIKLNRVIADLEENNRNDNDVFIQKDSEEVIELIDKISFLQVENSSLRDKSDELSAEVETLSVELGKFKVKRGNLHRSVSAETTSEIITDESLTETTSAAVKRRGDSPSKTRISDESPRLGKVRKCNNDNENESDSSGDWIALHSELGHSIKVETTTTSGVSLDFSSINECCKDEEIQQLKCKITELEQKVIAASSKIELDTMISEKDKLKTRCDELEASLEQMRKEYEDCEDYWQTKVNDERQLYEEEQRQSDEKFNELVKKMSEYEEQFAGATAINMDKDGRLSPIEEKCQLEQQYLELEAEFEQSQMMLEDKSVECEKLRNRIREVEQLKKYPSEALIATSPPREVTPEVESPASSPISYLWNQSTIHAPARDYQNPNWNPNNLKQEDNKLSASISSLPKILDNLDDDTINRTTTISPIQKPSSANKENIAENKDSVDVSDVCSVKSGRSIHSLASTHSIHKSASNSDVTVPNAEEIKQLRLIELQLKDEIKDLVHQRDCLVMELQQLKEAKPILAKAYTKTTHPSLTQKIQHLELKNRNLQVLLKQQQQYAESILYQTWQQQRDEINDLRNRLEAQSIVITEQAQRLANADLLVKDLYVENSHLTASVQRLEQQKARATLMHQLSHAAATAHQQHHSQGMSTIVPGMP